jgi:CheY-like chemotaxis protein
MTETNFKTGSHGKIILVVEDEGLLREMERQILESCGYRILDAESGSKAMELWQEHQGKIDLLLTDIVLPNGISGLELARRLFERQSGLKVIFTTGRIVRDLDRDAFEKINARFLQKPYQHDDLILMVKDALKAP